MYPALIKWLESHMLPCAYKAIFGIDCPGCGFQRACIALLRGNLSQSLHLYPAVIPILITAAVILANRRYSFDQKANIRKTLYVFTGSVIAVSYVSKMVLLYHH